MSQFLCSPSGHLRFASVLIGSLALITAGADHAHAAIIASESFQATSTGTGGTYDADTNLAVSPNFGVVVGNTGFVNSTGKRWGAATTAGVVSNLAGLTHGGVTGTPQSGGVRVGNISQGIARNNYRVFATTPEESASYFLSGLVHISSLSNIVGTTQIFAGVTSSSGAAQDTFNIATGFHYGLSRDAAGDVYLAAAAGNTIHNLLKLDAGGVTYQVVLRLDVSTTGNDFLSAWYAADGDDLLSGDTYVDVGNIYTSTASLGGLLLQSRNQGGGSNAGKTTLFDEIRFGTALSDVTTIAIPEPANFAFLLAGASAFTIAARRRKVRIRG